MKIVIHGMKNLNEKQQAKIKTALQRGEPVLDSALWEQLMLQARFTEARRLSNQQIIDLIRTGSHNGQEANRVIDVWIEGFYKRSNTVGYTYLGATWQWINRRFLDRYSESSIFSHVMHETMHRCFMFTHKSVHSTSVPYQVGTISGKAYVEYWKDAPKVASLASAEPTFFFKD
jgi:hypothetical protein